MATCRSFAIASSAGRSVTLDVAVGTWHPAGMTAPTTRDEAFASLCPLLSAEGWTIKPARTSGFYNVAALDGEILIEITLVYRKGRPVTPAVSINGSWDHGSVTYRTDVAGWGRRVVDRIRLMRRP
jgi:hypothetical protein